MTVPQFSSEDLRIRTETSASAAKATDGSTQTSFEEVGDNITIETAGDEFVHIVGVRADLAANAAIGVQATVRIGHRIRDAGDAEPGWTEFANDTINTGDNDCTNDAFTAGEATGSPIHAGDVGNDVEVDYGLKVDTAVDSTAYCNRNREVDVERFRRLDGVFGNQFRGNF